VLKGLADALPMRVRVLINKLEPERVMVPDVGMTLGCTCAEFDRD